MHLCKKPAHVHVHKRTRVRAHTRTLRLVRYGSNNNE